MKKSEKLKGKAAVADRKKHYIRYAVAAAAVIVVMLIVLFYLFNPFVAKNGDTVMIYYTETFENGTELYNNLEGDPLVFTIGNNTVITGLEEAVTGMAPNATKTVNISFDKAYGPYRNDLIVVMNRTVFSDDVEPIVGDTYSIRRDDGGVAYVKLLNLTSDKVTFDQNHPLAGENLTFTIRFVGFAYQ